MPKRKQEWFDDDDFWRELYGWMFAEERFAQAEAQLDKLLALTRPSGKSVLDLACGPGRFSIPLAKQGMKVTGVDRTKYLLDKARARAKAAKADIEWVRQDMRDFVRADAFDLAISMYTSFGYFDDKRNDIEVLENLFTSLRRGGVCLIDVLGKERLARVFQETVSATSPDKKMLLVQRHEIFDDWTRIRNEWLLIRGKETRRFTFHHTLYSGQELRDRMEQVGFDVELYGTLDGTEYGPNAERLIAVGRKP